MTKSALRSLSRAAMWVGGGAVLGMLLSLLWAGAILLLKGPLYFAWTPSFVDVPTERTRLIDGLVSYQSTDTVGAFLTQAGYMWRLERREQPAAERPSPSVDFAVISVNEFVHLGHVGQLTLHFFNNRLAAAVFCPVDFSGYLELLATQEGIVFAPQEESQASARQKIFLPPYTSVHTRPDYGVFGPPGVIWRDTRLDWEERVYMSTYED